MRVHSLFCLFMFMLMAACGKATPTKSRPVIKQKIGQSDMERIVLNQYITCTEDSCPSGLGRMFAINFGDRASSQMCSAFMIAPDMVMTNSHCIYTGKMDLETTCQGLYFVFPTPYGFTYNSTCSQILYRDPLQQGGRHYRNGENDFALIKLNDEIPLDPLELSQEKVSAASILYPMVTDLVDVYNARIVKLTCKLEKISERSGIMQFSNCPIISGNSGSAVLDDRNQVVGIIFASSNQNVHRPSTALPRRVRSNSKGYAFSMTHIQKMIGHLIVNPQL